MNFIEDIKGRGILHDIVEGTADHIQEKKRRAYVGIDLTASSLHVGHLAPLVMMKRFLEKGHQPVIVLGGATSMIGDPSFKAKERKLLDQATLKSYEAGISAQVKDFFSGHDVLFFNNYEWFKNFSFLDFLRDVGKHISVNYMMAKESVKSRLVSGISYTEFAYQLLQGYDFYHLYQNHGVTLQMGGSDQWGNLLTGVELIRRMLGKHAYALTTSLVLKSDGKKFGKSEEGALWLNPSMTPPYAFYQYFLNLSDADAPALALRMVLEPIPVIQAWIESHQKEPHKRFLQKKLAHALTTMIHGSTTADQIEEANALLFGKAPLKSLFSLSEGVFSQMMAQLPLLQGSIESMEALVDLMASQGVAKSKRLARQLINQGSIQINKEKIDSNAPWPHFSFIKGRYLLLRRGKRDYYLVDRKTQK